MPPQIAPSELNLTVFVSYQRGDAPYAAGWLAERIQHRRPDWDVILDVDSLVIGGDFREHLYNEVLRSDVMICVIGSAFNGQKLADQECAGVGNELSIARAQELVVVPFVVDASNLPDDLPQTASWIKDRHGMRAEVSTFNVIVDAMIDRLTAQASQLLAARLRRAEIVHTQAAAEADNSTLNPVKQWPAVLINLGAWVDEDDSELGRSGYGFYDDMPLDALYGSTRGWWRVNRERITGIEYAVAVHRGVTRGLFKIEATDPASTPDGRWAFVGRPVTKGAVFDHFVGRNGKPVERSYGAAIRYLVATD